MKKDLCCALFISITAPMLAQTAAAPPPSPFREVDEVRVDGQPAGAILDPLLCDTSGNLFVQSYTGSHSRSRNPVTKISSAGKISTSFAISAAGPDFGMKSYGINSKGDFYALAGKRIKGNRENYVIAFSQDGSVKSSVKLDIPDGTMAARHIAVFDSGAILVTGYESPTHENPQFVTPYNGLFSADGKFVKRIVLDDDAMLAEAAKNGNSRVVSDFTPDIRNEAVELTRMISASDGAVYLMRSISPAMVYKISDKGEVVSHFVVDSEEPNVSPGSFWMDGKNLGITFWGVDAPLGILKIVHPSSGRVLDTYPLNTTMGPGLACFSKFGFTFLSQRDGQIALKHAVLK